MEERTSHYSLAMLPDKLWELAQKQARGVEQWLTLNNAQPTTVLVLYTGMSGVAHATALRLALLMLRINTQAAYVRKEDERSHGATVETSQLYGTELYAPAPEIKHAIFVDDFIDTGKSRKYAQTTAKTLGTTLRWAEDVRWWQITRWNESPVEVEYGEMRYETL